MIEDDADDEEVLCTEVENGAAATNRFKPLEENNPLKIAIDARLLHPAAKDYLFPAMEVTALVYVLQLRSPPLDHIISLLDVRCFGHCGLFLPLHNRI
jgi:hypothetical protein